MRGGGSQVRTSSGTFLTDGMDPLLDTVRRRIAHLVMLPEENQEAMSILRYKPGQYYRPHEDFFADEARRLPRAHHREALLHALLQSLNASVCARLCGGSERGELLSRSGGLPLERLAQLSEVLLRTLCAHP